MNKEFEVTEYLDSFGDGELRARFLHASGYAGRPDLEHLEAVIALGSGPAQQLLLASRSTSSDGDDPGSTLQTIIMVTDSEGVDWVVESVSGSEPGGQKVE